MFGIGSFETIVIILVILIAVNPKDLPAFIRKLGYIIGKLKHSYDLFMQYIRDMEYYIEHSADTNIYKYSKSKRAASNNIKILKKGTGSTSKTYKKMNTQKINKNNGG